MCRWTRKAFDSMSQSSGCTLNDLMISWSMPCFYHLDVEISMVGNLRVQTGDNMKSSILSSYHPIILSYHAKNPSLKIQSAKIAWWQCITWRWRSCRLGWMVRGFLGLGKIYQWKNVDLKFWLDHARDFSFTKGTLPKFTNQSFRFGFHRERGVGLGLGCV